MCELDRPGFGESRLSGRGPGQNGRLTPVCGVMPPVAILRARWRWPRGLTEPSAVEPEWLEALRPDDPVP